MSCFDIIARSRSTMFVASAVALWTLFSQVAAAQVSRSAAVQATPLELKVLSSPASAVSGGNVLVQLRVPVSVPTKKVFFRLNGQDVTGSVRSTDPSTLQGLVAGLHIGSNALIAGRRDTGQILAKITITNHSITGPVLSGQQQAPFICQTQDFKLQVIGGTLGAPLDKDCSIAARVDYVYWSTDHVFRPLRDPSERPSDLAQTTTQDGKTVNYIVRLETGTINRAIYQIAMLHDPKVDPEPDPWTKSAGWNGRLLYTFGGGCNAGYHQGNINNGGLLDDTEIGSAGLANGFAIATSSLNRFGTNCNDVIAAETAMMVKEHFIKRFGVPAYTIGLGVSGGSMQVYMIARNYPGLVDGIIPIRSFPDTLTFDVAYLDCDLLIHAFDNSTMPWTDAQKAAVAGHQTFKFCTANNRYAKLVRPNSNESCDASISTSLRYDPITNQKGVRCTLYDDMVNVYGRDTNTGFARRPIDNVGVQYGLKAFNDGIISADQFLELNQFIGGFDIDGNFSAPRMVADRFALAIAYRTGRINSGQGLDAIPIIDYRPFLDAEGDLHDEIRSRVMRARLIAANGQAVNQIIITVNSVTDNAATLTGFFLQMDHWLSNIKNDTASATSPSERVARDKPRDLVDACYNADFVKITGAAACEQLYPPSLEPRLAAGEPLTNDFIKCALKPVSASDYVQQPLTAAQFARLRSIFPEGVCDYTKPAIEQRPVAGTWLEYPSPGGFTPLNK